jgi:hypothetical protein
MHSTAIFVAKFIEQNAKVLRTVIFKMFLLFLKFVYESNLREFAENRRVKI